MALMPIFDTVFAPNWAGTHFFNLFLEVVIPASDVGVVHSVSYLLVGPFGEDFRILHNVNRIY